MARAGLSKRDEQVAGSGARRASRCINSPARQFRSAVEMSQMAPFTDAAVAIDETNFSTTFISYYTYGAAIATALDLSLRDRSNGEDLARRLHARDVARARQARRPAARASSPSRTRLKDARDRLAEVSGDRAFADEFFDKYIEGREVADYARLLRARRARAAQAQRRRGVGRRVQAIDVEGGSGHRSTVCCPGGRRPFERRAR